MDTAEPPPPPPPSGEQPRRMTHRRSVSTTSQGSEVSSSRTSSKSTVSRLGGCPGCHCGGGRFDDTAVEAAGSAAKRLKSSDKWGPRCKAARELGRLGCAAAHHARLIVGALRKDPHPAVRCAAGEALAALANYTGVRMVLPDIVAALKDPEEQVRIAAAEALGAVGQRDAVAALEQASKQDPQEVVRKAACKALALVRMGVIDPQDSAPPAASEHDPAACNGTTAGELMEPAPIKRKPSLQKSSQPVLKEVRESPELWGVQVSQLLAFEEEIMDPANPENLVDYCNAHSYYLHDMTCVHVCMEENCSYGDHRGVPHVRLAEVPRNTVIHQMIPNMHAVVQREIKPRTKDSGCSAAMMMNPSGLRINAYTTHAWDEEFSRFVHTLKMSLDPDDVVWVCSFAIDQNADISEILNVELDDCPFAQALQCAEKHVVIVDSELRLIERAWCLYEIAKSSQCSIPLFLWTCQISDIQELGRRVATIDVRNASATFKKDLDMVQHAIEKGIGHDAMNSRLRHYMGDRVRFYQAAVQRCEVQLNQLSGEIEANKVRDAAAKERLAVQLREKLQLLQEEAHHRAEREADHRAEVSGLEKRLKDMEQIHEEARKVSQAQSEQSDDKEQDVCMSTQLEKELDQERRKTAELKAKLDELQSTTPSSTRPSTPRHHLTPRRLSPVRNTLEVHHSHRIDVFHHHVAVVARPKSVRTTRVNSVVRLPSAPSTRAEHAPIMHLPSAHSGMLSPPAPMTPLPQICRRLVR